MSYYLANKIQKCRFYSIDAFTSGMRKGGFGTWAVEDGDTEVPVAREFYEKLCNVTSWDELKQILLADKDVLTGASKMDRNKRNDLYDRAVRLIERLEGSIARAL